MYSAACMRLRLHNFGGGQTKFYVGVLLAQICHALSTHPHLILIRCCVCTHDSQQHEISLSTLDSQPTFAACLCVQDRQQREINVSALAAQLKLTLTPCCCAFFCTGAPAA